MKNKVEVMNSIPSLYPFHTSCWIAPRNRRSFKLHEQPLILPSIHSVCSTNSSPSGYPLTEGLPLPSALCYLSVKTIWFPSCPSGHRHARHSHSVFYLRSTWLSRSSPSTGRGAGSDEWSRRGLGLSGVKKGGDVSIEVSFPTTQQCGLGWDKRKTHRLGSVKGPGMWRGGGSGCGIRVA